MAEPPGVRVYPVPGVRVMVGVMASTPSTVTSTSAVTLRILYLSVDVSVKGLPSTFTAKAVPFWYPGWIWIVKEKSSPSATLSDPESEDRTYSVPGVRVIVREMATPSTVTSLLESTADILYLPEPGDVSVRTVVPSTFTANPDAFFWYPVMISRVKEKSPPASTVEAPESDVSLYPVPETSVTP